MRNLPEVVLWLAVAFGIVCGVASADIAASKGRGVVFFFVFGFLFNVVGILYAIGIPETLAHKVRHALVVDAEIIRQRAELAAQADHVRAHGVG